MNYFLNFISSCLIENGSLHSVIALAFGYNSHLKTTLIVPYSAGKKISFERTPCSIINNNNYSLKSR